jgi:hypothetical protein
MAAAWAAARGKLAAAQAGILVTAALGVALALITLQQAQAAAAAGVARVHITLTVYIMMSGQRLEAAAA